MKLVEVSGERRQEKIARGKETEYLDSFTLNDLKTYWLSKGHGFVRIETDEEIVGSFKYLLRSFTVCDLLWSIDYLFASIGDRAKSDSKPIRVFDLKSYLEEDMVRQKEVSGWR